MWLMFLLGALTGIIGIFIIAMIAGSIDESKARKEKKSIQDKTDTVARVLHKASWSLGYICGKHDAKAGIDEIPAVAYKRICEEDKEKDEA